LVLLVYHILLSVEYLKIFTCYVYLFDMGGEG